MAENRSGDGLDGGIVLGYPRIGRHRELKRALEAFWAGKIDAGELQARAAGVRKATRSRLHELGLEAETSAVPANFSFYDQVLDVSVLAGAIPPRFEQWLDADGRLDIEGYSVLARGEGVTEPLEMTKWFDSNYHYLVPEIGPDTSFAYSSDAIVDEFVEGLSQGYVTRPVIVGPVTYLLLAKATEWAPEGFSPLDRLDALLPVYEELLSKLKAKGARWVQLDEPGLVTDLIDVPRADVLAAAAHAYDVLGSLVERPKLFVTSPYSSLDAALPVLAATPIEALHIDLVRGDLPDGPVAGLETKTLVAGVVDGHNIWRTDLDAALSKLEAVVPLAATVLPGTSTSLIHVPHTLEDESKLGEIAEWLAFADEKVREVQVLARALHEGIATVADEFAEARIARAARLAHPGVVNPVVRSRAAGLVDIDFNRVSYAQRHEAQLSVLDLPPLPTTTIGSFPQTPDIRRARSQFAKGEISEDDYKAAMRQHISDVIALQERIGLDVLVHGEAERNDMVQYFAEHLDGFAVTENGWVQSYGSRCTRPSILWGDVDRPNPITVEWSSYAQSLTKKPVKGMLTGPVTILAWSFVRDDQPLGETANQVALALRDEIADLEKAGIGIVQVDEPALRELLPLKKSDQDAYLEWSVGSFRLATAAARPETQVHTHLCYSEFGDVIDAIDGLDADVTSIEAARSKMEVLADIRASGFSRQIGPGVYDIHSPRVPSEDEVEELLSTALKFVPEAQLWVNPDCGLKTRGYSEVTPSLQNLVDATKALRESVTLV